MADPSSFSNHLNVVIRSTKLDWKVRVVVVVVVIVCLLPKHDLKVLLDSK